MNTEEILYSRSAASTDDKCQRQRFLNYEWANRGLTSDAVNLALWEGICIHDGLAAIAAGMDIDTIGEASVVQMEEMLSTNNYPEYYAKEQICLVEGLLRGFYRQMWPILMKTYPEIVFVEEEMVYPHDGVTLMSKGDIVLRDTEGLLWYLEYKSTSSNSDQWISSWTKAVQVHTTIKAIERRLGEPVAGMIIQGLYKGYLSKYTNKQESILCYAYHSPGQAPFNKAIWATKWGKGLKKSPIWQRPGGCKAWIDEMPLAALGEQFPQTPPIFLNEDLVERYLSQRGYREKEIRTARHLINDPGIHPEERTRLLDMHFSQNFDACTPGWGYGCDYVKLCHGSSENPLEKGFSLRISHHEPERLFHDAK